MESTKSTLKSREGGIGIIAGLFFFLPQKCVQFLALCDSDLSLNENSVVSFLSHHHLAAEQHVRTFSPE